MRVVTGTWPVPAAALALGIGAVVLLTIGTRFARLVDRLADRTGLGEAVAGAVLLGATTSLPGLVVTVLSAVEGEPDLAVSNAVGGIAAQTTFLAVADVTYRRANLEHAAASVPNLLQSSALIALLALVLIGVGGPELSVARVHVVSVLLPVVYLFGLRLAREARSEPMWRPEETPETRSDVPQDQPEASSLRRLWVKFAVLAAAVAVVGFVVGRAGISVAGATALSGSFVGGVFTSVVTSLPELVAVLAAVRIGALTMAVSNIIGGNAFDVLMVAAADVAYTEATIYGAISDTTVLVVGLTVLLTAVLSLGLLRRAERGIGFEGVAILLMYILGFAGVYIAG